MISPDVLPETVPDPTPESATEFDSIGQPTAGSNPEELANRSPQVVCTDDQ